MAFTPTDLAGCRLWLAADRIAASDGDAVATWSDLSGNGFNGTGAGTTNPTCKKYLTDGGGPAVFFDAASTSRFVFGDVMASAAAGEVFLVVKSTGANCDLWAFGNSDGADVNHYPYAGVVHDSWGLATGQRKNFTPSMSISAAFRKYNVRSDGATWAAFLDGVSQLSTTTAVTVGWNTAPVLGAGVGFNAVDFGFGGWIAEVIVYNSVLSFADRALVMSYLDRHFSPPATRPVYFHPGRGPVLRRAPRFYRTPRDAGPRQVVSPLAEAVEADTATVLVRRKTLLVAQAVETDTATSTAGSKARTVVQATEADTATVLGRRKARAVAQAAETNAATAAVRRKTRAASQASEVDTASALARLKVGGLAQALEVDTARLLARLKQLLAAQSATSDTARPVTRFVPGPVPRPYTGGVTRPDTGTVNRP